MPRHKCFVSFHRADEDAVLAFKEQFDDTEDSFLFRGQSMPEDIINSHNDDYVIGQIRERFLKDSSITIVMIGVCTWSRRFVDWEVQASLRRPGPNGLLAILLDPSARRGTLPHRVKLNVESGYALFRNYPESGTQLARWIDEAYDARITLENRIENPRARKASDDVC